MPPLRPTDLNEAARSAANRQRVVGAAGVGVTAGTAAATAAAGEVGPPPAPAAVLLAPAGGASVLPLPSWLEKLGMAASSGPPLLELPPALPAGTSAAWLWL